jgi:YebC/PmpR family DNA-binding regulatory protein
MSGHSKWSTIKHKKAKQDAKRGKLFTKLGRAITIAAREGGGDEETNFALRLAIEKAKKASMPLDNIERALKRGTGEDTEGAMERAVYGGYGPGGVAIVVDAFTDNTNRTVSEFRKIFEDHGGSLAESSSVLWQFHQKGRILVKCAKVQKAEKFGKDDKEVAVDRDEVMMTLMDFEEVEDIRKADIEDEDVEGDFDLVEVITPVKKLAAIRKDIEDSTEYIVDSAEIIRVPENTQKVSEKEGKKIESLLEELDDHDDVEDLWFNTDLEF